MVQNIPIRTPEGSRLRAALVKALLASAPKSHER
jgi:DNA polymerase I-like protein with 3'-5' exonuclease and polymerase domains